MKKIILKIALLAFFASAMLMACDNSPENKAEKVEEAKSNLEDAKNDLNQAIADSTSDYIKFKAEAETKLSENDRTIANLKVQMKHEKKVTKMAYNKMIDDLEDKNAHLKMRIAENKETAKDKWENFKLGFNKDMDELGKSISQTAKQNMKN